MEFDPEKAVLKGPNLFPPFRPKEEGTPLADAGMSAGEMLLVVERGGHKRAFLVAELAYHHLVQSTLAGEPYLVSF